MAILSNAVFLAAILGHMMVDTLNGQRTVLFTFFSSQLGLSNTQLGLFTTLYILTASLCQPLFGYLTDKIGPRWVLSGGVLWMGAFYSLGILTPGFLGMGLLAVASLGSGAFHPAGVMQATMVGRRAFQGRETTTASIFFLFGQMGFFMGPLIAGLILQEVGVLGILAVSALTIPVAAYGAYKLPGRDDFKRIEHIEETPRKSIEKQVRGVLVILALVAAFQAWSQQNVVTYLPKLLSDLGKSPAVYGLMASLFMAGSALGNVVAGNLADRHGKRRIATTALSLAVLPMAAFAWVGDSYWLYLITPLAGAFTGAVHSIIVVLAQRMIPSGMGLASGLILGFMFSAGALGSLFSGYLADLWGFPIMFLSTAGLVLAAALLTIMLGRVENQQ